MLKPILTNGPQISEQDPVYQLGSNNQLDQPVQAIITVIRGVQNGLSFRLGAGVNLFGRHEGRLINDTLVSRRHMQITRIANDFFLEDLQSKNGTYVNNSLVIQSITLQHGDLIQVGETMLVFEISNQKSAILGFGATLPRLVDNEGNGVMKTTRFLNKFLEDETVPCHDLSSLIGDLAQR
jgi:pSer/pThr/pTyr-binding forkhead associated (FHA) protein